MKLSSSTSSPIFQRRANGEDQGSTDAARDDSEVFPVVLSDLWRSDPHLREPIIDGLLRRGQVGNLISTSKSYKTYLVLSLAVSVALGRQWLDRFALLQGRVLLIDLELQRGDITR